MAMVEEENGFDDVCIMIISYGKKKKKKPLTRNNNKTQIASQVQLRANPSYKKSRRNEKFNLK